MNFARAAGLLRDHWFLAVVALGIAVCLVVPEWVAFVLIPVQPRRVVVVMMFLTAFSLETRILLHRTIHPWPVFLAVGVSYGIVPLLGWLGSVPLGLLGPPDLGIGLIVISCVPCTLASAVVWTRMARGDEGTVLLTTIATTCTSWIFTSLWLQLTIGKALTLDLPALMFDLLLILVAPLAVGQMARLSTPLRTFAQNRKPLLSVLSQLIIVTMILHAVLQLLEGLRKTADDLPLLGMLATATLALSVHLAGLTMGLQLARWLRCLPADSVAVAFSGSQKTMPVALQVLLNYFADFPLAVLPLLCFHVGQFVLDTLLLPWLAPQAESVD